MNLNSDEDFILNACTENKLYDVFEEYLNECLNSPHCESSEEKSKAKTRPKQTFPNLAGFCRYLKISIEDFEKLSNKYPSQWGRILTALEDEALNSDASPSLISAYLKKRLNYEGASQSSNKSSSQMQIFFEHDIFEDGG